MDVGYYVRFIVASVFIIGTLVVALKFSKRFKPVYSSRIKVLDRVLLGSQSNLFIVDVDGVEYIIGATNHSIQLIDKQ